MLILAFEAYAYIVLFTPCCTFLRILERCDAAALSELYIHHQKFYDSLFTIYYIFLLAYVFVGLPRLVDPKINDKNNEFRAGS